LEYLNASHGQAHHVCGLTVMGTVDDMQRDYRAAFLRYLPRHDEAALHSGYLIGRNAVANGVSMLELVCVHHDVLLEVLRGHTGRRPGRRRGRRVPVPRRGTGDVRHGATGTARRRVSAAAPARSL
jgi:hypothetical protein